MSEINVVVTDESITLGKITVKHNEIPWRTATNRHTTTSGYSWGWIDGAPGNVCWANDETFNQAAASEIVGAHNRWLEDQQPLSIKIIKAERAYQSARTQSEDLHTKYSLASDAMHKAKRVLEDLYRAREAS